MLLTTNNSIQSSLNCVLHQDEWGILLCQENTPFYFFALIPAVVSDLLCQGDLHLCYLQSFLHPFMTYNSCVKLPLKLPPLQAVVM